MIEWKHYLKEIGYNFFLYTFTPIMKLLIQIYMFLSWEKISKIIKSKFVSTTYIWIVVLPTLAKLLSEVPEIVHIENINFVAKLPFSWYYLYFSAILFFSAKLLYLLLAPKIYNDNLSYEDFERMGRGREQLFQYSQDGFFINLDFHKTYEDAINNPLNTDMKALFWRLWNELNYELKIRRVLISLLLYFAYFFILIVFAENFLFVLKLFIEAYSKTSLKVIVDIIWQFLTT